MTLDTAIDKLLKLGSGDQQTAGLSLGEIVKLRGKIAGSRDRVAALKENLLRVILDEEECPQVRDRLAQNYAQVVNRVELVSGVKSLSYVSFCKSYAQLLLFLH